MQKSGFNLDVFDWFKIVWTLFGRVHRIPDRIPAKEKDFFFSSNCHAAHFGLRLE